MKVLLVNRHLGRVGGDATYTLQLARLLEERGHSVTAFGLQGNVAEGLSAPILMEPMDFPGLLQRGGPAAALKVLGRTIYSPRARALMDRVLEQQRPDIVHLQNIHHHITPSVITAAAARRVPVVWTLHDYTVICPNGNLWRKGSVCEQCRPLRFHRAVVNRCKRDSMLASAVAAVETSAHRLMGVFRNVQLFIAPSRFLQEKLQDFGFFPDKVVHLDNFLPAASRREATPPGRSLLYIGRLIEEKGISTLLKAAELWGEIPLVIAGDGPMRSNVEEACRLNRNISFVGQVGEQDLQALKGNALAVLVPSTWYENQPFSVLEAFAACRPVVASELGALPELIGEEEERGLLFQPGDPQALAAAVRRLWAQPALAETMGVAAGAFVRERFSSNRHYEGLMQLYRRAGATGMDRAA
jgi:glycosyltransferase involved in cell wall biosynthesis